MKKGLTLLMISILAFIAFGCMSPEEKETQNEILAYLDEIEKIEALEKDIIEELMMIENSNDTEANLDTVNTTLKNTLIPQAKEIEEQLATIHVTDEALLPIHEKFLESWHSLKNALTAMENNVTNNEAIMYEDALSEMKKSQTLLNEYYLELQKLCEAYDIDLKIKNDALD